MKSILPMLFLLIGLPGCKYYLDFDRYETNGFCKTGLRQQNIDASVYETYISPENIPFVVSAHYDFIDDYYDDNLFSAYDIGMMAYIVVEIAKENNYPNIQEMETAMQNIHVLVINTDDEFARLYSPILYGTDPEQAIEYVNNNVTASMYPTRDQPCWEDEIPEHANMFFMIRSSHLHTNKIITPVHELFHPVLHYAFGDLDPKHEHKLWRGETNLIEVATERYFVLNQK